MDAPGLDARQHDRALAGLRRINAVSRTARTLARPILDLARRENLARLSLLDIASGGGDVPVAVAVLAKSRGLTIDLTLFDQSPTALSHAQSAASAAGISATTHQGRAPDDLPAGPFDVITCTLFLHHLSAAHVTHLLSAMRQRTSRLILISDLQRNLPGLAAAHIACRLLTRSPIVHHDGPASVRAAWTRTELASMATQAGLSGAIVRPAWPFRMILVWEKPGGTA